MMLILKPFLFLHLDDAVEDGFPVLVAGEIVVGDEIAAHALRIAGANHALDIIRGAVAGFAALHVDDAAEAARIRAAAPGVETSKLPRIARDVALGQERQGPIPEVRHVLHEIVERLKTILVGRAENLLQPPLGLAREERDAERQRFLEFGGQLGKHREAAAHVEAADRDLDSRRAQLARDIDGARELVGLHSDQAYESAVPVLREAPDNLLYRDEDVGLVADLDLDIDVVAQRAPFTHVEREPIQA